MIIGRGAGIILTDNKGRILLQHRDNDAPRYPGRWGLFGGQLEKDETPEQAVRRETKEEIGIELTDLKFFKKYKLQREKGIFEAFFFVAPITVSVLNGNDNVRVEGNRNVRVR